MGTTGSSNSISPPLSSPPSAPLSERDTEAPNYFSGSIESHRRDYTIENTRQRTRTSTCSTGNEPRSQGPSPYTTLRGDELWNQRPSAPSLSNLRPPHRETLLTYAAQMTGWQAAEGHSPTYPQHPQYHHEAMEFSRAISQLAMANQQLATAHGATLAHLEVLYGELRRERELRRRGISETEPLDESLKKRLTDADDEVERQRLEDRICKLEYQLENRGYCQLGQRYLQADNVVLLQDRVNRLEDSMKTQGLTTDVQSQGDITTDIPQKLYHGTVDHIVDKVLCSSNVVPEIESTNHLLESHETVTDQTDNVKISEDATCSEIGAHLIETEEMKDNTKEEILRLSKEVDRLKMEELRYQSINEQLLSNLAEKDEVIERLTCNYEESRKRCQEAEESLNERKGEFDELLKKFDVAKQEVERLLREIDACNLEKDTAEAKISTLEQDLQKSILEREKIQDTENEKNLLLKAQLSEEVLDKKKQIKALEDALDEIQRLKETIKTERKYSEDEASGEDSIGECLDDPQQTASTGRSANLDEFRKELTVKREARQRAIAAVSLEMERLRRELDAEKEAHSETTRMLELLRSAQGNSKSEIASDESPRKSRVKDQKLDEHEIAMKRAEAFYLTSILKVSDELRNDIRFQLEKIEDLRYHLERNPEQHKQRIQLLMEVSSKTKEAVIARERRAKDVKDHLAQILARLGDRSFLDTKDDISTECERQLENINSLKCLYNGRLKVLTEIKETVLKEHADVKERLDHSIQKSECLEDDLKKADEKIDAQDTEISNLESQLGLAKADCRDLQNQMSLINGLFTQMLLGASSADMDLDRLTQLLQENHDLISDMAKEESTEAAALPKLLLDLIAQVEASKGSEKCTEDESDVSDAVERKEDDLQQDDIAHNLPKVWRVLFELLSCHAVGTPSASTVSSSDPNTCYKSVDTPAGPRLVISVSKTYIRLKELILEKKHLEKEMNRMKQLNSHLEGKLVEQEKKLSTVSTELTKTWTIVDRMQAQHKQLHTHEKILRYELQQKRKMLQELKQELEYCREKWESARQKNTNTEIEWRSLRREFAARKALAVHDSFNNSAESGFSDERGDDTDEEDETVEDRIRLGMRRRTRKESPRAPTSDTESEQPTDTELSESKTGSSATLEQRTPTPESDAELDETENSAMDFQKKSDGVTDIMLPEGPPESVDPLDQALTNVIQNLIHLDGGRIGIGFSSPEQEETETENSNQCHPVSETDKSAKVDLSSNDRTVGTAPITKSDDTTSNSGSSTNVAHSLNNNEDSSCKRHTDVFGSLTTDFEQPTDDTSISHPTSSSTPTKANDGVQSKSLSDKRASRSFESVNDSDNVSVDSSSSSDTVKEFPAASTSTAASSSDSQPKKESNASASAPVDKDEEPKPKLTRARTSEEVLAAREDRLKRLEEQAEWLMKKMNATSRRGSALSTRLEELHEAYGEPPVPPPMPDVLPSRRLRTDLTELPGEVPESSSGENSKTEEKPVLSGTSEESPPDNAP